MLWLLFILLIVSSADARCHYRLPAELVPCTLVRGIPGGLNHDGTFIATAVFNWSEAMPHYTYKVIDSFPSDAATNASLGATNEQTDPYTTLAEFRRHPEHHMYNHVLDNYEHYRITVQVFSDCEPARPVTQATYFINLTATFNFTHNYTSAHALVSTTGWLPAATLVMHPDLHYEFAFHIQRNVTHYITVRSSIRVEGLNNYTQCAGVGSTFDSTPCFAVQTVSIERNMTEVLRNYTDHIEISYALSQFTQMGPDPNATINGTIPNDFNVSRTEPLISGTDYRFDICQGTIDSYGNVSTEAYSDDVNQTHVVQEDFVSATCRYRIFFDEINWSPFVFLIGWFDYDFLSPFEHLHNSSALGNSQHIMTIG